GNSSVHSLGWARAAQGLDRAAGGEHTAIGAVVGHRNVGDLPVDGVAREGERRGGVHRVRAVALVAAPLPFDDGGDRGAGDRAGEDARAEAAILVGAGQAAHLGAHRGAVLGDAQRNVFGRLPRVPVWEIAAVLLAGARNGEVAAHVGRGAAV